jgi:type-F conjugative transfer system pilin assembly protein TrbC
MLYALKTLILLGFIGFITPATASVKVDKSNKPDMQKVYDEAVNWSKTKLDKMPDTATAHETASIGVCRGASEGEPLMIKPPCSKKQRIDEVVDGVIDDDKANTSLGSGRNPHGDILSASTNQAPKILVFVSFSMPKASLRAFAKEAAKHNAVLVMRGLKGDSFKTTQKAFLEILTEGKNLDPKNMANQDMQGFEVNPELFKTYKITQVPVFVLIKNTHEISRLSGNVSLDFAAKKLKENL